jgi:hypothetical protein
VGLWNFQDNLNDSSGNGFNLSGTPFAYTAQDNFFGKGVVCRGGLDYFTRSSRDALLAIIDGITIEGIILINTYDSRIGSPICSLGKSVDETEAGNICYYVYLKDNVLNFQWEYGAGINADTVNSTACPINMPFYFTITRDNNSVASVNFYINAQKTGFGSDNKATGGTDSQCKLLVGSNINASHTIPMGSIIYSLKIIPSELTHNQIKEEYNKTLGGRASFWPYVR